MSGANMQALAGIARFHRGREARRRAMLDPPTVENTLESHRHRLEKITDDHDALSHLFKRRRERLARKLKMLPRSIQNSPELRAVCEEWDDAEMALEQATATVTQCEFAFAKLEQQQQSVQ